MAAKIDRRFSDNISVAKLFAITGIIFSHYWSIHPVPLPLMSYGRVTIALGLLIFSFTSGYFSAFKYGENNNYKSFWSNKIYRGNSVDDNQLFSAGPLRRGEGRYPVSLDCSELAGNSPGVSSLADRLAKIVEEKLKTLSWQAAGTV